MAPATSGCWSSHDPTANTVTGTPSRPATVRRSWSSTGSPDPWNVNATCRRSAGPWATKAAAPPPPPAGGVVVPDDHHRRRLHRRRPVEGAVEPGAVGGGGRPAPARARHVEGGEDHAPPLPAGVFGHPGLADLGDRPAPQRQAAGEEHPA